MSADDNSSIGWFLAGLGLGAMVGVLFAPKSGNETREYLANRASEGADYVKNSSQQARESFGQWSDKGKDYVNRAKQQVQSAVEAGKRAYQDTANGPGTSEG